MKQKTVLIILFIYFVGLFFRLYQLGATSVYPDEITWMVKGKETIYALTKLNLNYFKTAWWNNTEETYAIGWPAVVLGGLFHVVFAGTGKYSLHWFPDIVASRLPLALIGPLLAVALYLFGKRYLDRRFALALALAYTLNPISIALDRWLLHDSFLTLFSFLALSTFIAAVEDRRLSYFPGIWLSLTFLTKPHGILPLVGWTVLILLKRQPSTVRLFISNIVSFLLITTVIWPQSWLEPVISVPKYFYSQYILANVGRPVPNFFFIPTRNPHWSYFFFQLFFRTPIAIVALFLATLSRLIYKLTARHISNTTLILPVFAYFVIDLIAISVVATKGGVRYALPLLPWIYLAAGFSLQKIKSRLLLIVIFFSVIFIPFIYHPTHYLYYNLLIGGPQGAQKFDLVGLCFGSDKALHFLDENKIEGLVGIIGCYHTGPYHSSRPQTTDWSEADILILESSYAQQYPDRPEVTNLTTRELIHTVVEHGVVTARVYR